ncbi:hypothetical protein FRC05_011710 [Tulasnella sp. 425]|nr:hypothetical protein FRC05_011710 [Tulasnella sp. 425]
MNIVSTATVLPRTPTDILGQLSVVFVGPGPLKESVLKSVFRIRKTKVWEFLMWLKGNNPLYKDRLFSLDHLSLYEEDGCVPGLEDATIVDSALPVAETFEQETAGLEAHPATLLSTETTSESPSSPKIFLEAMGVSDPEGDKITGRTYTASALRNLVPKDKDRPDLIISRGSDPKPEYKNTDLFPVALSPELTRSVADHLEREGKVVDLSPEQLEVVDLLTKVNAVAAHIPGSQASKINFNQAAQYCPSLHGIH